MRRLTRRSMLTGLLMTGLTSLSAQAEPPGHLQLFPFAASPFPYAGEIPSQGKPFLDATSGARRGHTSPRGGVYWEDETYSDRRVLLYVPPHFDPHRPAVMVIYLHGNKSTLMRDVVARQQIPQQLAASGLNAVLVAPQFALDALDSSAGKFWDPNVFSQFLDEAAEHLSALTGGTSTRHLFSTCPVVLAAYSGGYNATAAILLAHGVNDRLKGVALFDALYAEIDTFADWIARHKAQAFFFSAYSASTRAQNLDLQRRLEDKNIATRQQLPQRLGQGDIVFLAAGDGLSHNDFMSQAWTANPLTAVLARLRGTF